MKAAQAAQAAVGLWLQDFAELLQAAAGMKSAGWLVQDFGPSQVQLLQAFEANKAVRKLLQIIAASKFQLLQTAEAAFDDIWPYNSTCPP